MSRFERCPIGAALALLLCVACADASAGPDAVDALAGAVLVARDGRTPFEGAYGLADRERRVANTPQTRFRVGSMYKMVTAVATLQLVPGAQHVYGNYGFLLLGALIERLSGQRYDDHVAARVLAPAGTTATGTAPEDPLAPGRSIGYTRQLVPGALVSNAPTLPYRGTPAGGGYSTVGDLELEPNGGSVVVVLSNLDPPAATQMAAFILDRLPTVQQP